MSFLFSCAVGYLFVFVLFIVVAFFVPKKFSRRFVLFMLILYVVSLTILAFFIKPQIGWDLYRHYISLNTIRYSGMDLFLQNTGYGTVPVASALFYLVTLLSSNQFLPGIAVAVEYALFCNILYNLYKSKKLPLNLLALCIFAQLAFCPIIYSFSGIRNTLACSIFAYGVFMECFKQKKIAAIVLYAVAVATHSSVIILVALRLLVLLKPAKLISALTFAWPLLGGALYSLLMAIPIPFFNMAGAKLFKYTETIYELTNANVFAICICVFPFTAWLLLSYWTAHRRKRFSEKQIDLRLFLLLGLFTLPSCLYPHIAVRMMYQIGFLVPFAIAFLVNNTPAKLKYVMFLAVFLGMGVCFAYYSRLDLEFYTGAEMALIFA